MKVEGIELPVAVVRCVEYRVMLPFPTAYVRGKAPRRLYPRIAQTSLSSQLPTRHALRFASTVLEYPQAPRRGSSHVR